MVTEREQQGIAAFYKEEGLREGYELGKAEGKAEGEAEGMAKGMAKGMAQGQTEIAKAMLKNGLSVEMVSACTGLAKDVVESLKP